MLSNQGESDPPDLFAELDQMGNTLLRAGQPHRVAESDPSHVITAGRTYNVQRPVWANHRSWMMSHAPGAQITIIDLRLRHSELDERARPVVMALLHDQPLDPADTVSPL
ncbi:hypothetical protein [Actinocorallia aurantiaca]|uniref:Uncharacterized protein n=1 Tax=Actinocorallia aurantiaca TaxID=46204 RepID=A0ABN3U619_9ACTN